MDIRLKRENNQILFKLSQVRLERYRSRGSIRFLWSGLYVIVFLGAGIWEKRDFGSVWNPFTAVAIGTLFIVYSYVYQLIKERKTFRAKTAQMIAKKRRQGSISEISFTDARSDYRDADFYLQANWSHFACYDLYKDCLFIINDKDNLTGIAIGKDELPAGEWQELLNFLAKKLPVMKA
jgi:hypothetical protein